MLEQADLAPLSAILDRVSPIDYKAVYAGGFGSA